MRLFSGLFWGIFLLTSGVIILLKLTFNLQVSSGKLIFGFFILLIGVSMLTTNLNWNNFSSNDSTISFSSGQQVDAQDDKEYAVVFGSSTYDLTKLEPGSHIKINCDFSSCTIKLPSGAVQVNTNSAFGNVHLPDGSNIPFGNGTYSTSGDNKVVVDVTCAFGSVTVSN
jgi:hypothetical protein